MNPIEELVSSVREYHAAHPEIEYSRDSYVAFDGNDKPCEACVLGLALLAKIPDLTEEQELRMNEIDEVETLYPGISEYLMPLPKDHRSSRGVWDVVNGINHLNIWGMELEPLLTHVAEQAYLPKQDVV